MRQVAGRAHIAVRVIINNEIDRANASAHSTVGDMNGKTMVGGRAIRLDTALQAFEQDAAAVANWRYNYETLRSEGHQYNESRDQAVKAIRDECFQAEAHRQKLVQEAEDRKTEM